MKRLFKSIFDMEGEPFSVIGDSQITMTFDGCENHPDQTVTMKEHETLLLINCKEMRTSSPKLAKYKIQDNKFKRISLDSGDMESLELVRKEYQNS